LKQIAYLFVLNLQLRRVGDVLVLTSPAIAKVSANRLDSIACWLKDAQKPASRKAGLDLRQLSFDRFAYGYKGNKHDKVIDPSDPLAAKAMSLMVSVILLPGIGFNEQLKMLQTFPRKSSSCTFNYR